MTSKDIAEAAPTGWLLAYANMLQ